MPAARKSDATTKKGKAKSTRKNASQEDPKKQRLEKQLGLTYGVGRLGRMMRKMHLAQNMGMSAAVFMAGVLDYITSEMLEGAGIVAEQHKPSGQKRPKIKPRHLQLSVRTDPEFEKFMANCQISDGGVIPNINEILFPPKKGKKGEATQEM